MTTCKHAAPLVGLLAAVAIVFCSLSSWGGLTVARAQSADAVVGPLAAACGSTRACLDEAFLYDGKAIHPLILRAFAGLPSDAGAVVTAIDLEAAQAANQFCCTDSYDVALGDGGRIVASIDLVETFSAAQQPREDCPNGCWFSYGFAGTTDSGVHVVVTSERSGGSAIFSTLLLLKTRKQLTFDGEGWTTRLQLLSLGKMNLAGEAGQPVTVSGNVVHLGDRDIPVAQ